MKVGEKVQRTIAIPVTIERTQRGVLTYSATVAGDELFGTVDVSEEVLRIVEAEPDPDAALEKLVMDCIDGELSVVHYHPDPEV